MSAKPTPGPHEIVLHTGDLTTGYEVKNADGIVAIFPIEDGWNMFSAKSKAEAEANARAWVDGMAAIEMVERIRAAMRDTRIDTHQLLGAIRGILNEAKP